LATYGKPRFLGIVDLEDNIYTSVSGGGGLMVTLTHRGEEMATAMGSLDEKQEIEYRNLKTISEHGEGPLRGGDPVVTDMSFLRIPSDEDISKRQTQAQIEDEILQTARALVEWHKLEIKLIDAESILDGKKLFFYFTAETRVDFRTLVKDLARKFKTRIELRQMGVRDEARIIRGLSSCGRPCCCSYWLNQFAPIGIKMVKEQNIALNPAKISGICGRLMCCMSFEHRVYKDLWSGLPGPGSKIKTPEGNYIVLAMDVAREAVRCHKPSGGDIVVPIANFSEFKQTVISGKQWESPEEKLSEEQESNAVRNNLCGSCRRSFDFNAAAGVELLKTAPRADASNERRVPKQIKAPAEKSDDSGGGSAASERKRQNRRRGHRGGRRHRADADVVVAQNTPEKSEVVPSHIRHVNHSAQLSEPGLPEARRKTARLSNRRRRPKRSAAETEQDE
jgi:cell fate regulator YaaT (PSP1 superfamily)